MSRRSLVQALAVMLVVGALLGAGGWLQHLREEYYPAPPVSESSLYITSGRVLRYLSLGYQALAADLYWIRTIQYYGDTQLKVRTVPAADAHRNYALLYPLLDLTTTLDPRFHIAYRFGAIFLAEGPPGGPGRPDLAIKLLEKGLRERPDRWEYMQDMGFVHYWWTHDFQAAAAWFRKASDVPGGPWFLRSLAATTLAEGGDRHSSRVMWESIRQSAEIEWLRNESERRLAQLTALDSIEQLQQIVDALTARNGRPPAGWTAVAGAMRWRDIPRDPTGTVFELDASGRVRISPQSKLSPLPVEPQRLSPPVS
jgi:hypothetical protein